MTLALECEKWHVLPVAGGLDDQPAGVVPKMGYLLSVYNAFSFRRTGAGLDPVAMQDQHPKVWRMIASVEAMRMQARKEEAELMEKTLSLAE